MKQAKYIIGISKFKILITFLCIYLCQSCSKENEKQQQIVPIDVDFYNIQLSSAKTTITYPGNIEGEVNVEVKTQATGYIETIYVKEGEYVQKGQSLFKIKADIYDQQIVTNRANFKLALAAEQNAKIELQRIKPLVEGHVMGEPILQTAIANLNSARAQVAQAESEIQSSKINAGFTVVKAQVSGYIGRIPNRIGNLVSPNDAEPLTTLSKIDRVLVYFSLSESDLISYLKKNKDSDHQDYVSLTMADGTSYDKKGSIQLASGNIDPNTGSLMMKAIFDNPDRLLRSGGSGKINLTKNLDKTITVPISGVKDIQDKYFVFVLLKNNKISMRPIEIEGTSENSYIVKRGLQIGDKVAFNNIDILSEGTLVKPTIKNKF